MATFDLDKFQRDAAASRARATLVLAGPGSGKTAMLTCRTIDLAKAGCAQRVLCLTFTKAAAKEVEKRVKAGLGGAVETPVISTFHSFCLSLLRMHPVAFGFTGEIVDDDSRLAALSAAGFDGAGLEGDLQRIDALRERRVGGEFVNDAMKEVGAVDFISMISNVVEALERNRDLAARICGGFDDILIDEYQDSSPLQDALVGLFYDAGARVWAVGDDDQSIYSFRAADVSRMTCFAERYPGAEVMSVGMNYRCRTPVIEASARLVAHNRVRLGKILRGATDGPAVRARGYIDGAAEASAVTAAISKLTSEGVPASEIAVLARTNSRLESFPGVRSRGVEVLTAHGAKGREWPYVFIVGMEDDAWPVKSADVEEERRIAYVAMTRSNSVLAMTFAANRDGSPRAVSRFLIEAGLQPFVGVDVLTGLPAENAVARWPRTNEIVRVGARSAESVLADNLRAERPARFGAVWSETDDSYLSNMFECAVELAQMAKKLQRLEKEVCWRLEMRGMAPRGGARRLVERRAAERRQQELACAS